MGARAQAANSSKSIERTESTFRMLFDRAWKRIDPGTLLVAWEVLVWSVIAFSLGQSLNGYYDISSAGTIAHWCGRVTIALSPFLIGHWVYRAHVEGSHMDDAVRVLPIPPAVFFGSRMAAVGFLWVRIFGPLISLAVYMGILATGGRFVLDVWYDVAVYFLTLGNTFPYALLPENLDVEYSKTLTLILFILQAAGWFIFPLTWGFYWGTLLRKQGSGFFVGYFLYFPIPVVLYSLLRIVTYRTNISMEPMEYAGFFDVWSAIVGLTAIGASLILFIRTCSYLERRR